MRRQSPRLGHVATRSRGWSTGLHGRRTEPLLIGRRRVILGHHVQLVLRGETLPAGLLGAPSGSGRSCSAVNRPASPASSARSSAVTVIARTSPSPPSKVVSGYRGTGAHDTLADRAVGRSERFVVNASAETARATLDFDLPRQEHWHLS